MLTRTEHRRERLRELIKETCSNVHKTFANKIDRDPTYISRLLYPTGKAGGRNVGDEIAEAAEKAFSLPKGWFDLPIGSHIPGRPQTGSVYTAEEPRSTPIPDRWPFERVSATQWASLNPLQKKHIEDSILLFLQKPASTTTGTAKR